MKKVVGGATVLLLAMTVALTSGRAVLASSVEDFYRGKQVTFVVAFTPGGMYGLHTQLIAEYLPRYIPGAPTIVAQHMPGAGGVKAANYLYSAAARDGSVIGMVSKDVAVSQRLRPETVRYNAADFHWIGSAQPYVAALYVWRDTAGVDTLDDIRKKEIVMGSSGKGSHEYMETKLLNALVGTKIRLVTGYRGAADMHLAMERGETHARVGAWNSLKATKPDWLSGKKVAILLQTGLQRQPDLPDVPTLIDVVSDADGKRMFEFIEGGSGVGWSVSTPPGVPADRVAALRVAFDKMAQDPDYIADAKKRNVDIQPMSGAEVEEAVKRTLAVPQALIDRIVTIAGE